MIYKALGYAVWNGTKWYLGRKAPSLRTFAAGGLGLLLAGAAAAGAKRELA
jgi:hypothetical protein